MTETVEQYCTRIGITVERYHELKAEAMAAAENYKSGTAHNPQYVERDFRNRKQRRRDESIARHR